MIVGIQAVNQIFFISVADGIDIYPHGVVDNPKGDIIGDRVYLNQGQSTIAIVSQSQQELPLTSQRYMFSKQTGLPNQSE